MKTQLIYLLVLLSLISSIDTFAQEDPKEYFYVLQFSNQYRNKIKYIREGTQIAFKLLGDKKAYGKLEILNDSMLVINGKMYYPSEFYKIERAGVSPMIATGVALLVVGGAGVGLGIPIFIYGTTIKYGLTTTALGFLITLAGLPMLSVGTGLLITANNRSYNLVKRWDMKICKVYKKEKRTGKRLSGNH